jgi:phage terminase large subunit-like protein
MHPIDEYARAVVAGRYPAGKFHRLACERHIRDRGREGTPGFPYVFRPELADRFFRFASRLKHYKGEWAGQRITLEPHQQFRLGSLFAWVDPATGFRRFRTTYDEVPRKNGKSLEAAVVALYLVFFDREPGAEGYVIATKREQAKIVFGDSQRLVSANPELKTRIEVLVGNLNRKETASKLQPLGADENSTDGLNPHCVIIDEAHAMTDRGLIDVMETATGARRQPVIKWITTAGNDLVSPCGDQHGYAIQILERALEDETTFAFIAHADEGDDWTDEATWRKANPNFGVSVKAADMRALVTKAIHMPTAANAFKQKRLNQWVNVDAPWLSMEGWRAGQTEWNPDELEGETCFIGIDLSSKIDLTAVVLVFPPNDKRKSWRLIPWCLTPADTLEERAHRDRAPYLQWVEQGFLRTNPGNRIDQSEVLEMVRASASRFKVRGIGVDPWAAVNLTTELETAGFLVAEVAQTFAQMSGVSKDFEADVLDGTVDAGRHPLMTWAISNVVVQRDNKDNIYPVKKRSRGRIDPVIAALLGRKMATTPPVEEQKPQYQMFVIGGPVP